MVETRPGDGTVNDDDLGPLPPDVRSDPSPYDEYARRVRGMQRVRDAFDAPRRAVFGQRPKSLLAEMLSDPVNLGFGGFGLLRLNSHLARPRASKLLTLLGLGSAAMHNILARRDIEPMEPYEFDRRLRGSREE